jgi:catechol 2,3-dioxygenase-like lactoylglutathione lyase family enzyme
LGLPSDFSRPFGVDAARPRFAGIDHIGLTVPDIGTAIAFFRDALGCVEVICRRPTPDADPEKNAEADDFLVTNLGVYRGARVAAIAMLRCGHGSNIELFDYTYAGRDQRRPNNADLGGHHLAFYTDDLPGALTHLEAHGATIMGAAKAVTTGPEAGLRWCYFLAPWGLQMELVSYPQGKAYEHAGANSVKLWSPREPAR